MDNTVIKLYYRALAAELDQGCRNCGTCNIWYIVFFSLKGARFRDSDSPPGSTDKTPYLSEFHWSVSTLGFPLSDSNVLFLALNFGKPDGITSHYFNISTKAPASSSSASATSSSLTVSSSTTATATTGTPISAPGSSTGTKVGVGVGVGIGVPIILLLGALVALSYRRGRRGPEHREIEIPEQWIQFVDDNVLASKLLKLVIDAYNKSV